MSSRLVLGLAAAAAHVSAASLPANIGSRDTSGVLSFALEQVQHSVPVLSKRADTDIPIYNITSTSYLIAREWSIWGPIGGSFSCLLESKLTKDQ